MKYTTWGFFVLMLIATFSICLAAGDHVKQKSAAAQAAQTWLTLVDTAEYAESWETAASYFKNAVTAGQWQQAMAAARAPLGAIRSRQLTSQQFTTALPGAPDGEYVVIQYQTSFQNKKSAIETVTPMRDTDGQWRVSGYFIK